MDDNRERRPSKTSHWLVVRRRSSVRVAFPGDYAHISTYFCVPIVGPLIGGAIAAFAYNILIRDIFVAGLGIKPNGPPEPAQETPPSTV